MSNESHEFQDLFSKENDNIVQSMTVRICDTFKKRNPYFNYDSKYNPKRVLTKPSQPIKNDGYDNENSDYILYVHGLLGPPENEQKYVILDILGSGTFGQVVKCKSRINNELVSVKVIKNKPAYTKQSLIEVKVLEELNSTVDPNDVHNLLRLKESFMFNNHLCLVFELLSVNLYELIKQNNFKGLSTNLVRIFAQQILSTLIIIKSIGVIHCDLKPENILLKNLNSPVIKVIDYGSSCFEEEQIYTYIQSRFYRSPEVLLGLKYTTSIDMWSFGCIVAELYLGLPIFPGSSEYNQLSRIMETIGNMPDYMITESKNGFKYFNVKKSCFGDSKFQFKDMAQYSKERNKPEKPSKRYFSTYRLEELILKYPLSKKNMSFNEIEREKKARKYLLDFLKKVLEVDPLKRLTPEEAINHPFITGYQLRRFDEIISLGRGILKKQQQNQHVEHSMNNNIIETDNESNESEEEEEIPPMLTGIRRKSYANTEARSSLSISPYSRKRIGSASSVESTNQDDSDMITSSSLFSEQLNNRHLRLRHNKEHRR